MALPDLDLVLRHEMEDKPDSKKGRSKKQSLEVKTSPSALASLESAKPAARMRISPESKKIISVDLSSCSRDSLAGTKKKASTRSSLKRGKLDEFSIKVVEDIWKRISSGEVNLYYATVGYGLNERPILDYDILVNLLINYGYRIDDVMAFIDDFTSVSAEDDTFPMLMMNSHVREIYEDVKHLEDSIYDKLSKKDK